MPFEGIKGSPPPPKTSRPAPERKASPKTKAREEAANGVGQLLAFGCMVTGNLADAGALGMHWPNVAHELAAVAESDERMAKGLDYLLEVGPYGNLIVVVLPLVAQVLANHKIVKAESLAGAGVVHPEALEAQVKTDMARQAAEAIRQQQAAEAEMRRLHAEMNGFADSMADNANDPMAGHPN